MRKLSSTRLSLPNYLFLFKKTLKKFPLRRRHGTRPHLSSNAPASRLEPPQRLNARLKIRGALPSRGRQAISPQERVPRRARLLPRARSGCERPHRVAGRSGTWRLPPFISCCSGRVVWSFLCGCLAFPGAVARLLLLLRYDPGHTPSQGRPVI